MDIASTSWGIWGTPDPRDSGAYPEPSTASMPQWAWEFLRRRDDYRRAWQKRVQPFVDGDHYDLAAVHRHNWDVLRAYKEGRPLYLPPPWGALLTDFKVSGDPASHASHNSTLDPRRELPPWFEGLGVVAVEFATQHTPDSKMRIEFDLDLPIGQQSEGAHRALLLAAKGRGVVQPEAPRMQIDKFPRYLRLLDFREARMMERVIGKYLFPDVSGEKLCDLIRKGLVSASQWQDNYWRIALHDDVL